MVFMKLKKSLCIDGSQDDVRINDLFIHLRTKGKRICHQVIYQSGISMAVTMDGTYGCILQKLLPTAGINTKADTELSVELCDGNG